MKEKLSIVLGVGVAAAVLITLGFYVAVAGDLEAVEYALIALVLALVIGSSIILWKKTQDMKAGLPTEDEFAKKVTWKAGYYAFIAAIWSAVGLIWYNGPIADRVNVTKLTAEQALGAVILLSGAIFLGLVLYLNRKGDIG